MFDNHHGKEIRKYDSSLRAPTRNQFVSMENQWIKSSDEMLLSPAGVNGKGTEAMVNKDK